MKKSLLAASVAALLLLQGCSSEESSTVSTPLMVSTLTVGSSIEHQQRSFKGQVMPAEQTPLSFRIEGELVQRDVIEGQQVKKGQLLAKLDDRKLRQRVADAKAQFELTNKQLKRGKELFAKQMISDAELDELTANMKLARANFRSEQKRLDYSVLTAPFDGVISTLHKEQFESINPGEAVVSLYKNEQVYVRIQLSDTVLAMLDPDQNQRTYQPMASFSGSEQRYPLSYLEHTSEPSPQSNTYEMWLTMPQVSPAILPGTSVSVDVDMLAAGLSIKQGFQLPLTALQPGSHDGQFYVWKWQGGDVSRQEVVVEQINSYGAVVASGIAKDDVLVTSSLRKLRQGQAVIRVEDSQ